VIKIHLEGAAREAIDRVNNSFGYVHGNVQVISNRANRLKSNGTREEHLKIAGYMEDSNA